MIELFTGGAVVSALLWWLRCDGPVRLLAGAVAVLHRDPARRRDARAVLGATKTHAASPRDVGPGGS